MFATSYSDLPYRTVPLHDDGFHLRIIKIPVTNIVPPGAELGELVPRPVQDETALQPLLESCFRDLVEGNDTTAPDPAPMVQALAHIALIERGIMRPKSRLAQQALRTAHLSLARRLIRRHLPDAALAPTLIAGLLGISVRHLHILFEETEMSFSETVTALRLAQSRRLLREQSGRTIAEVAFACGFESLATFYRLFSASESMTPGDYRARLA